MRLRNEENVHMGKQINYYMEYASFLKLAQIALEEGCLILKNIHTECRQEPARELSAITPETYNYLFLLPGTAEPEYGVDIFGKYYVEYNFNRASLGTIEAGFSQKRERGPKGTTRERLYVSTGYYEENGVWVPRPEETTRVYEKLARTVRKLAPYTSLEIHDAAYDKSGEPIPVTRRVKEYVSPQCMEWRAQGYELYSLLRARERYADYLRRISSRPL